MPWKPLPAVAFAICTHPFRATEAEDLPLQVGDHIYIIEQGGATDEWYRGYLVAPPSLLAGLTAAEGKQLEHRVFSGIFPCNCVQVRETLGDAQANGGGSPTGDGEDRMLDAREKRKSMVSEARRSSRRLSRKKSSRSLTKKTPTVFTSDVPLPRDPNAPKPLAPVPMLRVGDETGLSAEEPLVDEIASCLREWHDARLHEVLLARGYNQLARVQDLIKRVDNSRNQLMHDVMTIKELAELRENTVWDLVQGNKLLNDDIVVRSPTEKGRILTADDSVLEMTKLQANMSILERPPKPPIDTQTLFHILVDVRNFIVDGDVPATLQVALYLKEHGERPRPISENYSISLPIPDDAAQSPETQSKTLFINLTSVDIGAGADKSSLYAVFKLLKDEPVRHTSSRVEAVPCSPADTQPSLSASSPATTAPSTGSQLLKHASLRGRRSVFGSQRKKGSHSRDRSDVSGTSNDTGTVRSDDRPMSNGTSEAPREVKMVRRTAGIGAIEITRIAQSKSDAEHSISLWTPCAAIDDKTAHSDDWSEIIREFARSATGCYDRVNYAKRVDVFVKSFATMDIDGLIRTTPTLLYDILPTPKMGFSGVPTTKRSDIYLTLSEPIIPRAAVLAHSKFGPVPLGQRCQSSLANLQLTLEVRRSNGERIEDCIFTAANHAGHTAWRTTGIERGESWNQTIRLSIPVEEVPGSHIVMSIADSPNFPFALSWVPLWENEAFVRDGEHTVALYVYDEYSSSIIGGKGAYLALPPWHDRSSATQGNATTVALKTFLCSTEYSQDPTILGVLNWRHYHGDGLLEVLERFAHVPEVEIVKLLSQCFGALFEILHEYETSEEYENVVFYDFVVLLNIARDKRFELTNIIEDYATTRNMWPYASHCLMRAYGRLISNPMDSQASRKLRATFKVGDQMLKLIVETTRPHPDASKNVPSSQKDKDRHPGFRKDLQRLFVTIMALLRNPMPILLGTQTLLIQHFHTWLPELTSVMTPAEILEVATDLLDACAHASGKMVLYRLILIINYSQLEVFKLPEVRTTLVANTFRWLAPYWGEVGVVTDQYRDQVRLCCSVLATQIEHLHEDTCQYIPKLAASFTTLQHNPPTNPLRKTFSLLFPTSYPFPSRTSPLPNPIDEPLLELSALLAASLTTPNNKLYFDANQVDIMGVLLQALRIIQSILTTPHSAFPSSWLSLLVAHHRYAIAALERIADVLVSAIPDASAEDEALDFDTEIWRAYFDTLFAALSSPALAMETFPEQKRRAIWKIAGDVREVGAGLLMRSWEAIGWETDGEMRGLHGVERLGGYQVQFVPELVPAVVELGLGVHASLRRVGMEILKAMIVGVWEIDRDLSGVQTAMIDCLDRLCRTKGGVTESVLQRTFVPEMLAQFKPFQGSSEQELYDAVVDLFGKIEDLLSMLSDVHQGGATGTTPDATKLVDTLRLMEFLKDVQSEDAFIRYVHQLASLQLAASNYTEAGLALQMHADRYQWDPSHMLEPIPDWNFPAQSAFERKEALYFELCQNLEKGRSWHKALVAYRELATQYEHNTFDYAKLARAQRAIAGIHDRIAKGDRFHPRYFRVVYRGLGFSPNLRDKEFIFEGYQSDRLATFHERLQQMYTNARILRPGEEPETEGQFLQVFAVSAHKDLDHTVYQRMRVTQAVREYALMSSPNKFNTTSRQTAPDVPLTEQVVGKVVYTIADQFPTISRRSEIIAVENISLSPIEAAVERATRKTQDLLVMERQISTLANEDANLRSRLVQDLTASVDVQSDSSVARYRSLLPSSQLDDAASAEIDPMAPTPPLTPMQNALRVALLDHALAVRRCLSLFTSPNHLATKAELVPRFEATFAPELAVLFPGGAGLVSDGDLLDQPDTFPRETHTSLGMAPEQATTTADTAPQSNGETQGTTTSGSAERSSSVPGTKRVSLPFLKRAGSKRENGNGEQTTAGAPEKSAPRALRSASKNRGGRESSVASVTRRISLFTSGGSANGNGSNVEVDRTGESGKKRMSLLRGGVAEEGTA